jgi:hypothetical protein
MYIFYTEAIRTFKRGLDEFAPNFLKRSVFNYASAGVKNHKLFEREDDDNSLPLFKFDLQSIKRPAIQNRGLMSNAGSDFWDSIAGNITKKEELVYNNGRVTLTGTVTIYFETFPQLLDYQTVFNNTYPLNNVKFRLPDTSVFIDITPYIEKEWDISNDILQNCYHFVDYDAGLNSNVKSFVDGSTELGDIGKGIRTYAKVLNSLYVSLSEPQFNREVEREENTLQYNVTLETFIPSDFMFKTPTDNKLLFFSIGENIGFDEMYKISDNNFHIVEPAFFKYIGEEYIGFELEQTVIDTINSWGATNLKLFVFDKFYKITDLENTEFKWLKSDYENTFVISSAKAIIYDSGTDETGDTF